MEILINLKVFADCAYFRLINHIKPAKHRRQLTYQDPSFQWLKVLLLGVEKWRLKLEFFGCFCEKTFTRILTFLFVNVWAISDQPLLRSYPNYPKKTTTIDYFSDNVKFPRKFSIGAISLASDELSDYFTVFVDFANFTT